MLDHELLPEELEHAAGQELDIAAEPRPVRQVHRGRGGRYAADCDVEVRSRDLDPAKIKNEGPGERVVAA